VPYADFLVLQLIGILFFAAFVPVAGWLADKFGRKPTLIVITSLLILFGLTFGWWLSASSIGEGSELNTTQMMIFLIVGMALMGLTFGPMSAVLPELFPTNTRYTGSGIAYNVSSILGAALTPFVAQWLVLNFSVAHVGYYLSFASVLTLIALIIAPETKTKSLDTEAETVTLP
jgi:MFS family permease